MSYLILKYVHILGASVLLGTGVGIAFFMLLPHRSGDARVIAGVARIVVIADYVFTASAVVLQPITGALLVWLVGYSFLEGWVLLSLLLYAVTGLFWLPVVRLQNRMRDLAMASVKDARPLPAQYHSSADGSPSAFRPLPRCLPSSGW